MKILIDDGLSTVKQKRTGIGWYTIELMDNLHILGYQTEMPKYPSFFMKLPDALKRVLYMFFFSRRYVNSTKYDCIHYTNFFMPPTKHKAKVVVTIHDLSPYYFPETFPALYRSYAQKTIRNSVKYADRVLVESRSVYNELSEMFPEHEPKMAFVKNFVRPSISEYKQDANKKSTEKYFLYVGVIEKRKNLPLLCKAFKEFNKTHTDTKLILVGKPGYGFEDIEQEINNCDAIVYKNYVSEDELLAMYANALAFVFPSLYEGFGKPVMESMFFNLPIIASSIPTNLELHELHGSKLLLFDKNDSAALIALMGQVYANSERVHYSNLQMYFEKATVEALHNDYHF